MASKVPLIGLSGTNGSGKDTVGLLLSQKHNYCFISVTELLRAELRRRGLPIERRNLRALSAEWRREHGLSVLVDQAIKTYETQPKTYTGLVISSLRNPYEADRIHELSGVVLWVDADPKVRFNRIQQAKRHGREGEDDKTYEEFIAEEAAEMQASGDAATLDMNAVKKRADHTLINESSNLVQLTQDIQKVLGLSSHAEARIN